MTNAARNLRTRRQSRKAEAAATEARRQARLAEIARLTNEKLWSAA